MAHNQAGLALNFREPMRGSQTNRLRKSLSFDHRLPLYVQLLIFNRNLTLKRAGGRVSVCKLRRLSRLILGRVSPMVDGIGKLH